MVVISSNVICCYYEAIRTLNASTTFDKACSNRLHWKKLNIFLNNFQFDLPAFPSPKGIPTPRSESWATTTRKQAKQIPLKRERPNLPDQNGFSLVRICDFVFYLFVFISSFNTFGVCNRCNVSLVCMLQLVSVDFL